MLAARYGHYEGRLPFHGLRQRFVSGGVASVERNDHSGAERKRGRAARGRRTVGARGFERGGEIRLYERHGAGGVEPFGGRARRGENVVAAVDAAHPHVLHALGVCEPLAEGEGEIRLAAAAVHDAE